MKKWHEDRNYRRIRDKHGKVIANIITIDGMDVEVAEEVFIAYSQADRRERYLAENTDHRMTLSLEELQEHNVSLTTLGAVPQRSVESDVIEQIEQREQSERLVKVLQGLEESEQKLIKTLFFDKISVREYAKQLGVRLNTVQYRRDKLLDKLRQKFFS